MPREIETLEIDLTEGQRTHLKQQVHEALTRALSAHSQKEDTLAEYKRMYRAKPKSAEKTFPWKGASNMVIPIVGITVDTVVARLMRAFLATEEPVEANILDPLYESLEKDIRDWAKMFFVKSGARNQSRSMFHDTAHDGTCFIKVGWESKTRTVHSYVAGAIQAIEVTDYEGPVWNVIPEADFVYEQGFDEFERLPWVGHRLRFTWNELRKLQLNGAYKLPENFKRLGSVRQDPSFVQKQKDDNAQGDTQGLYVLYELWGEWEILNEENEDESELVEAILTYSIEANDFVRVIYNPFFGHARHFIRVPFIHQPHEIPGLGLVEQSAPFQDEASTAHNQTIDAATAAIAGMVIKKPGVNLEGGDEIYPGRIITTDDPFKDINVLHLSMGNSTLPSVEQGAAFWNEKRTGVSAYNMGVESPVAGSRATATGTTSLINEGNMRFWVSIDDMWDAMVNLLYLTLQLEQQMRPEGTPISETRMLTLPQGDLRAVFGLKLSISSEKVNRDLEMQNLQILSQVLTEYYSRLMQAAAVLMNPQVPPPHQMMVLTVMEASAKLIKRVVERFEVQNIDELVPTLNQALSMLRSASASSAMAIPVPGAAGALPPGPPGGPQGGGPPAGFGG